MNFAANQIHFPESQDGAMMEIENRQALDLWRDITNQTIRLEGPDLTARQTAILLTIHLDDEKHTVRGLAKRLGLQKPAIVRALDSLQALGLVCRTRDEKDRRNVFINATEEGILRLGDIARFIIGGLNNLPHENTIDAAHLYAAQ